MSEYIDKGSLYTKIFERVKNPTIKSWLSSIISELPTIDPVHAEGACYCLECKHYKLLGGAKWCVLHMSRTHADDFCSYGKQREDEQ